jgi:ABC-type antimicrobial peptide transport system permease subunit
MAVMLDAAGLYGMLAYSVARRTGEIGVRFALGATRRVVLRGVLTESAKVVVPGVALGVAASLTLTRILSTLLYGVAPTDPLVLGAVVVCLVVVSLLAASVPAWRASRVNPLVALRDE